MMLDNEFANKNEKYANIVIDFYFVELAYNLFRRVLNLGSAIGYMLLLALLGWYFVKNYKSFLNVVENNSTIMIFVFLIYGIQFIMGLLFETIDFGNFLSYSLSCCLMCNLFLAVGYGIDDIGKFNVQMIKKSNYMFFLSFLVIFSKASDDSYNMGFSYYMLLPLLLFWDDFISRKHWLSLIKTVSLFTLILIYGNRGAILCFILYVVVRSILDNKKPALSILTAIASIVVYLNFKVIVGELYHKLSSYGIYSRTLMLLSTDMKHSSGRDVIKERAWSLINEHPLLGHGIVSDRTFIGTYPHNIILELFVDYGIILGTIVFLIICYIILKKLKEQKNNLHRYLLWICVGFVPLLFSETYLKNIPFFLLIGLCLNTHISEKEYSNFSNQRSDNKEIQANG